MKKFVITLMFISCFFLFNNSLNAEVYDVMISDGSVEAPLPVPYNTKVFNYFEEQRDNTLFYNFLKAYPDRDTFINMLSSFRGSSVGDITAFIFTKEEVKDYCNYKNKTDGICAYDFNNYTHAILTSVNDCGTLLMGTCVDTSLNTIDKELYFTKAKNSFDFYYINNDSIVSYTTGDLFSILSEYKFSYSWKKSGWWIFGSNSYTGTDWSYFLSKFYLGKNLSIGGNSTQDGINIENLAFNGVMYPGWQNFNHTKYKLSYYKENLLVKPGSSINSLVDIFNRDPSNLVIPANFTNTTLSKTNYVTLFPKKLCTLFERTIYIKSPETQDFVMNVFKVENDNIQYQAEYQNSYSISKNVVSKINPLYINKDTKILEEDFIKYIYQFNALDNKSDNLLYYNADCYSISVGDSPLTWNNPITNNDVPFVPGEYQNWIDPEHVGESNVVGGLPIPGIDSTFNIDNLLTSAWNGTKSIVQASYTIVGLATSLFVQLPPEISSFFITILLIGGIILLIKLFR